MRVPDRVIFIAGQALRADVSADIESVQIDDADGRSDHFSLTVNNAHGRWTDLPLFDEGSEATIKLGYYGGPYLTLIGTIIAPGAAWPESGEPTLSVEGYDLGYAMGRSKKNRTWNNVRASDIAAQMAKEYGLSAAVDPAPVIDELLTQKDVSDLGFLFDQARRWDYDVWVDGRTLHFGRRLGSPVATLRWGANIRSIGHLRKSVADVATAVVVKGWDPLRKFEVTGKVTPDAAANLDVVGARITAEVLGETQAFVTDKVPQSQDEAQAIAEARFAQLLRGYVEGELEIEGDPRFRRGVTFELAGVGQRFSGLYTVTASTHVIGGSGYLTTVQFDNKRQVTR